MNKTLSLLKTLTVASIKSRYRNTIYGLVWVILNPISTYLVQIFAFSVIFQIRFPNYPLYLMSGLLPWIFIVQSIDMCTGIFLSGVQFLKNVPIPPILLPLVQLLDNFLNFFFAIFLVLIYFLYNQSITLEHIAWLVLPMLPLLLCVSSVCIIFSLFNAKYKDVKFIVNFIFSLMFYLTPIFYKIDQVPENVRHYIALNPIYIIIKPFQELLINGPNLNFFISMTHATLLTIIFLILAFFVWKKMKRIVVFYV